MDNEKEINKQFKQLTEHSRYKEALIQPFKRPTYGNEDGFLITLPNILLPTGWTYDSATLYFWISHMYPYMHPVDFYTKENIQIAYNSPWGWNGQKYFNNMRFAEGGLNPQWTDTNWVFKPTTKLFELYWRYEPAAWSANSDTLLTYAHFIKQRFNKLR